MTNYRCNCGADAAHPRIPECGERGSSRGGQIRTTCLWKHLIEGLRKTDLLKGVISERDTIESIVFTTPSGEQIEVPEGSILELCVGLKADMYAIGIEHEPGSYGMTNGPVIRLDEMLAMPPPDSRALIFCFGKDGSERKLYKVDPSGTAWERIVYRDLYDDPYGAQCSECDELICECSG